MRYLHAFVDDPPAKFWGYLWGTAGKTDKTPSDPGFAGFDGTFP
jgi:hypothetical protein